jgi:hypothetical protein
VGIRQQLLKVLERGAAIEPDPDSMRELVTMSSFEGSLLVAKLAQHGIYARPDEWSTLGKSVSDPADPCPPR